jgi:aminoglycoside phosphotransferase (APT) family kinase protein
MSTIGHPLSDLANLTIPFTTASLGNGKVHIASSAFQPGATPGLPTIKELADLYFSSLAQYLPTSMSKAQPQEVAPPSWTPEARDAALRYSAAFTVFRLAAICQGIAARYAARQASSAQAQRHAEARGPLAEFAWGLISQEIRKESRL